VVRLLDLSHQREQLRQFSCYAGCHEHDSPTEMADKHSGVPGYNYDSLSCYNCHPRGITDETTPLPVFIMVLCLAGAAALTTAPVEAQDGTVVPAMARITYLTASSVYVDAGLEEGLQEGDELEVIRSGQSVATLKVTFISPTAPRARLCEPR